jgi:N-acetylglucosaminyl-diphospho-decaprenol L-rhamnosyltransferase
LPNLKSFTVSVVSHGHGAQVVQLLQAISRWSDASLKKVIVTVNAPELDSGFFDKNTAASPLPLSLPLPFPLPFPFALSVIHNHFPLGFGANHNRAFQECEGDYFFVLNPDLELPANPFPALLAALARQDTGCAYPVQTSRQGTRQDFERTLPTPIAILKRRFSRARLDPQPTPKAEWVSGAFMAFKASAFRSLGGFDERYFMYCEDADICLRLQLAGFRLTLAETTVVHHAQRQSLKNFRHLFWHVRSLLRLWNSAAYKAYKLKFLNGNS